jgi:hypothetical protein
MDTEFTVASVIEDDVHNISMAMSHGYNQGMGSQAIAIRKVCSVASQDVECRSEFLAPLCTMSAMIFCCLDNGQHQEIVD